ncbi:hypothetical protein LTR50_000730 [Elasticomyces elasticus]|nr:hypothetical protein LTR50_000730 [Elasticomyces elasticus]
MVLISSKRQASALITLFPLQQVGIAFLALFANRINTVAHVHPHSHTTPPSPTTAPLLRSLYSPHATESVLTSRQDTIPSHSPHRQCQTQTSKRHAPHIHHPVPAPAKKSPCQIRRARLQQLRQQQQSNSGAGAEQDEQKTRDTRTTLLAQILHPEASDRLGRIRLVKESRATEVEDRLIALARAGQLREKVSEAQLKEMLEAVSEQRREGGRVRVVRRGGKGGWGEEEDEEEGLEG